MGVDQLLKNRTFFESWESDLSHKKSLVILRPQKVRWIMGLFLGLKVFWRNTVCNNLSLELRGLTMNHFVNFCGFNRCSEIPRFVLSELSPLWACASSLPFRLRGCKHRSSWWFLPSELCHLLPRVWWTPQIKGLYWTCGVWARYVEITIRVTT